jgi:hypothetical protein
VKKRENSTHAIFCALHYKQQQQQQQQPMGNKAGSAENKNQTVKRKEEKRRRFIDAHYWESCWHLVHDFTKKKEENERARSLSAHGRPFKSI